MIRRVLLLLLLLGVPLLPCSIAEEPAVRETTLEGVQKIIAKCYVTSVLPTGSMKPSFDERYYLLVEKRPWSNIRVGDVIIYRRKEPYIYENIEAWNCCHRVIRISVTGKYLVLQGDNNRTPDLDNVYEKQYVGTVIGIVKND